MDVVTRQDVAKELLTDLRIDGAHSFLWESRLTTIRCGNLVIHCTDLDSVARDPESGRVVPEEGCDEDDYSPRLGMLHLFDTEAQFGLRIGKVELSGPAYCNPYYLLKLRTPLCEAFKLPDPVAGLRTSRLPLKQWLDAAFPGILFAVREELKLEALAWETRKNNRRELEYLGFKLGDYSYVTDGNGVEGRVATIGYTRVNENYLRQQYLATLDESLETLGHFLQPEYQERWERKAARETITRRAKVKEADEALMHPKDKE